MPRIYKICSAPAWREAERQGVFRGSADDARDGFIHFSSAAQVAETARLTIGTARFSHRKIERSLGCNHERIPGAYIHAGVRPVRALTLVVLGRAGGNIDLARWRLCGGDSK